MNIYDIKIICVDLKNGEMLFSSPKSLKITYEEAVRNYIIPQLKELIKKKK